MIHWSGVVASLSDRFEKTATFISRQLSVVFTDLPSGVNSVCSSASRNSRHAIYP